MALPPALVIALPGAAMGWELGRIAARSAALAVVPLLLGGYPLTAAKRRLESE